MPEIAPEPECTALRPLDDHARAEIAALAARQSSANGVLMKAVNYVGGQVESGLRSLPQGVRTQVDRAARLGRCDRRDRGDHHRAHRIALRHNDHFSRRAGGR